MDKNRIIVIEGGDGSGKKTQFDLLLARLQGLGVPVATFDFPRYKTPGAHFVERYLNGDYGGLNEVSPRRASLFYAVDRFEASEAMRAALRDGKVILCNRYVASNMAHQGAKLTDVFARRDFLNWLFELEFEILGIPRPGLNIILNVASKTSFELVSHKEQREYIKEGNRDIHEGNVNYQEATRRAYLEIAMLFPQDFALVECMEANAILPPQVVHDRVWAVVQPFLGLTP
jgi:dTMP kinase